MEFLGDVLGWMVAFAAGTLVLLAVKKVRRK